MLKVALVGAGNMARVHAGAYAQMDEAELVAVCDINPDAAGKFAEEYPVQTFTDFTEMISKVDVDVVDVCTPTYAHLDCIKAAAEAGKHVACEKPLARTVGQAQEAAHICEEAGVTLFIAHVLRWFPEYLKIKELISSGAIGDVVEIRNVRSGAHPRDPESWYSDYKKSGGVVLDLIVHDFDWLRWVFGKVRRVYARGMADSKIPLTDYALVTIRFESGVIAHVEGGWARPSGFFTSVEAAGTKGLLSFSNSESTPLVIERKAAEGETMSITVPESPTLENPYFQELRHFINCLEKGEKPDVLPDDGVEAVKIAEAALRSISSGQPVVLA
ncbi:Gfo/Idh/MocA family oxidoreductase [bacterium]|nr:Gfo/Idh/MocA family oxidoreductase [bacterium]